MKWFLIFTLVFAVGNCGVTKRHNNDDSTEEEEGVFKCYDREETEIPLEKVCDGTEDCERGEDESMWACAEKNYEFVCWNPDGESFTIPNIKTCDGNADCPLHRWSHGNITAGESKYKCFDPETEFVCNGEVTIPLSQKCDGNNDCPTPPWGMMNGKASDENLWLCKPEGTFVCVEDEKYIDESKLCDGVADCSSSEDENLHNCEEENRVTKRHNNDDSTEEEDEEEEEGVFKCYDREESETPWSKCVMGQKIVKEERMNLCGLVLKRIVDEFVCWNPDGESFTIPNSKTCDGNADCPLHRWSHGNTTDDESKYKCFDPETEFVCNGEVTIPLYQKCDGNNDCPTPPWGMMNGKTSDENLWMCKPEGRKIMKERELDEYLEKKGIHRRSVRRI